MLDLSLAGEPSQLPKRLCLTLNFSIVGGGELLDCSALAFRGDPKQIIEQYINGDAGRRPLPGAPS